MPFRSSRTPHTAMTIIILSHLEGTCEAFALRFLLGISEVELAECVKESDLLKMTDEDGYACVTITHPEKVSPKIIRQALFSSSLFGQNTISSALFAYYEKDFRSFLDRAEKALKELIDQDKPLAIRRAYDALTYGIIKMKVPLQNKDFCFYFIDKCMRIQREIIKFPSNSRNQLVLFCKIKGIAHYIGDRRSIGYINICMGSINHNIRPKLKANLYHANMKNGKDIILSLGDNDIKMMSSQFIVLYYLLEGQFSEGLNFAYSILFSDENDIINAYISTGLYSYATMCAAGMGDYDLAYDILLSGKKRISQLSIKIDISTINAFLAYILILKKQYKKALQIIDHSLGVHNGQIMTYSDLWCSRALCFYHYQCGEVQKSYDCFNDLLKTNSYKGISHSNYLIAPFVLELLCAYYINGYRSPQELTIQEELEYALSSPSLPVRAAALRVAGQIHAHDHGWNHPKVSESLESSLRLFRRFFSPPEMAKTLIALARMYQARGSINKAREAAAEARTICQHYGQPLWPRDLDKLLGQSAEAEDHSGIISFDLNMRFLHNFRSQSTFNVNNKLVNTLLASLLATFKLNLGCVFHASGTSIELLQAININGLGDNKSAFESWERIILQVIKENRTLIFNNPVAADEIGTPAPNDNNSIDISNALIAIYVDALDYGKYIFCISCDLPRNLNYIITSDSISFFESFLSTQICISMAHNAAWQDRLNSPAISAEYSTDDISLVYKSQSMKEVIERADNVARKDTTVIILGESGVGKELIVKRLHEKSRRKGEFVSVNLANIPYELFESECYGHEKGSFTGANRQKKGLFEIADSGTLFIDEIGDIPPALQVKLLRVLQEKQFMRVGGTRVLHSNFRLVTATNRDLQTEIHRGKFREDLFYRLNVISIHIPPLRERPDDILFLADHFLRHYCTRYQIPYRPISADVQQTILNYSWPGNVRELKNYIERYCVLSDKHFLPPPIQINPNPEKPSSPATNSISQLMESKPTLKRLGDAYFEYIYKATNGTVGGTDGIASILGVSRTTAYSWIERLGLKEKYRLVLEGSDTYVSFRMK